MVDLVKYCAMIFSMTTYICSSVNTPEWMKNIKAKVSGIDDPLGILEKNDEDILRRASAEANIQGKL